MNSVFKIALMSGAVNNAGDYLIEKRAIEVLAANIHNSKIDLFKRNWISYDNRIDELNTYDLICFAGGPFFQYNIYPTVVPFVSDLSKIETKVCFLGSGWYAKNVEPVTIYKKYKFNRSVTPLLKEIKQNPRFFCSSRDWETHNMLKRWGIISEMTGCPAWYDVNRIDNLTYQGFRDVNKIVISDAAYNKNSKQIEYLIRLLRFRYPNASIVLSIHNSLRDSEQYLLSDVKKERYNYSIQIINGSAEGLNIYDDCDLHVGFRVHAHIYCLSHGKTSLLINEDARGFGVNNSLGIKNIIFSNYFDDELNNYLDMIEKSEGNQYKGACIRMQCSYKNMQNFIGKMAIEES